MNNEMKLLISHLKMGEIQTYGEFSTRIGSRFFDVYTMSLVRVTDQRGEAVRVILMYGLEFYAIEGVPNVHFLRTLEQARTHAVGVTSQRLARSSPLASEYLRRQRFPDHRCTALNCAQSDKDHAQTNGDMCIRLVDDDVHNLRVFGDHDSVDVLLPTCCAIVSVQWIDPQGRGRCLCNLDKGHHRLVRGKTCSFHPSTVVSSSSHNAVPIDLVKTSRNRNQPHFVPNAHSHFHRPHPRDCSFWFPRNYLCMDVTAVYADYDVRGAWGCCRRVFRKVVNYQFEQLRNPVQDEFVLQIGYVHLQVQEIQNVNESDGDTRSLGFVHCSNRTCSTAHIPLAPETANDNALIVDKAYPFLTFMKNNSDR